MEFSSSKKRSPPQGPSSYDLRMWAVGFCELLDDHVRSPKGPLFGPMDLGTVNFITTSRRDRALEIMVSKGNHPQGEGSQ